MKYFVKMPDGVTYEYTADEIHSQSANGSLPDQCLIQEKGFMNWVSLKDFLRDPAITQQVQTSSYRAGTNKAATRYRDAYLVANMTDGFGKVVQGIGILIGALVVLASFVFGLNVEYPLAVCFVGVIAGAMIAIPLYVLGILVTANAQMLKASLDSAVHSSPFLSDAQKAQVMALD
jgi:hypothetical protein